MGTDLLNSKIKQACSDENYRLYFKTWKKVSKLFLQSDFLTACVQDKKLPKGLYELSRFNLSYEDIELKILAKDHLIMQPPEVLKPSRKQLNPNVE